MNTVWRHTLNNDLGITLCRLGQYSITFNCTLHTPEVVDHDHMRCIRGIVIAVVKPGCTTSVQTVFKVEMLGIRSRAGNGSQAVTRDPLTHTKADP